MLWKLKYRILHEFNIIECYIIMRYNEVLKFENKTLYFINLELGYCSSCGHFCILYMEKCK